MPTGERRGGKLLSFFPPHNRKEVVTLLLRRLERGRFDLADVRRHLAGPDFPLGGHLLNPDCLPEIYETGRGRLQLCARVHQVGEVEVLLSGPPPGTTWGDHLPLLHSRADDCGIERIILSRDSLRPIITLHPEAMRTGLDNLRCFTTRSVEVRMRVANGNSVRDMTLKDLVESAAEEILRRCRSTRAARAALERARRLRDPRRTATA
jgi:hypothetical protein